MESFYRDYLAKELRYPNEARRLGIEGKIYIQFIVEKDGMLSNIEIVRGIGGGCDDEAFRVIQQAPAWNAGQIRGQNVRQRMVMPIIFKLN
jgi:protein TonB